jgi:hypothetical protein
VVFGGFCGGPGWRTRGPPRAGGASARGDTPQKEQKQFILKRGAKARAKSHNGNFLAQLCSTKSVPHETPRGVPLQPHQKMLEKKWMHSALLRRTLLCDRSDACTRAAASERSEPRAARLQASEMTPMVAGEASRTDPHGGGDFRLESKLSQESARKFKKLLRTLMMPALSCSRL